jgi:integrase
MAKIALSDTRLRSLPAPAHGQASYWDLHFPSFGVRISQGGSKTFVINRDNSLITIGRYPIVSLAAARTEAKRLLAELTLGKVRPQSITYAQAVEAFLEEKTKARRARTVADYKRLLSRFNFKGQLTELTHAELQRRIKRFTAPGEFNHLLVALKVFCNWAIKRRYIEHNPTVGLSTHARPTRSRVLTDAELKSIWQACEQSGGHKSPADDGYARRDKGCDLLNENDIAPAALPATFGTIVRLLILSGQRRGEIAALRPSYLDLENRTICLPSSLTKNGREHLFPISARAADILSKAREHIANTNIIFPARGNAESSFSGWSKSKIGLDEISGVTGWTLHDIRRSVATKMAELRIAPHIIERILNHVTGTMSPLSRVYNRATYLEEMRAAIELWEAQLSKIIA